MSLKLSDRVESTFESCVHKPLLTYVEYPTGFSQRCFSYPQFLIEDNVLSCIAHSAFPDDGCLPMVMSHTDSDGLYLRYGDIVIMVVNDDSPRLNTNYPLTESSRYNSIINPNFSKGKSSVEFTALKSHPLSSEMMQVLDLQENIDFSKPLSRPVRVYSDEALPQTSLALIAQVSNGRKKYYGPFECTVDGSDIKLKASSSFDMRIAGFDESKFKFTIDLLNSENNIAAQFVDAAEFREMFDTANEKFDWISDNELLDALGRVSRIGESSFSKTQMRALKTKISNSSDAEAQIRLTPQRRQRMLGLVEVYENWDSLSDEVKSNAIDKADPEKLAQFVLSDENFSGFYNKVMENEQVRNRVEQDMAQYKLQTERIRTLLKALEEDKASAERELREYESELETKKSELAATIEKETEAARQERRALEADISNLNEEKERLLEQKYTIERQIRKTLNDMSDEILVSSKILENEIIKQIVGSIESAGNDQAKENANELQTALAIIEDEDSLSAKQVVDHIENAVCSIAGRDLTRNEVINLMICLVQGYIITLAGLPGTGKTSLATILAGALGLSNENAKRFTEVPVERGWNSYKDFIGYYNPLTKTLEKSNVEAFDAFEQLDREANSELDPKDIPPYLLLLDEANLSAIEHYWSPFLRACDSFEDGPFALSIGGTTSLSVPSYTRFIATVNFDHTTEELSPRFLDRSWTITLDPDDLNIEEGKRTGNSYSFSSTPALSMKKLNEVFGTDDETALNPELKAKLTEVLDVCSKNNHPISPRSQIMIYNYARTAERLMDRDTADSAFAPIDFAVSQKILPLLSGSDERLEALLTELGKVNGLPITKNRVEHMLEAGNDSGYYQYFV